MVYRIYVEKKKEFENEAASLLSDAVDFLGIKELKDVRIIKRYDVENIDEELFEELVRIVFSEPQTDLAYSGIKGDSFEDVPGKQVSYEILDLSDATLFATEFLPGQFDQRADSAAECIQFISQGEKPVVRSANLYALYGNLKKEQIDEIKKYVINPVESREAILSRPETIEIEYERPEKIKNVVGFISMDDEALKNLINEYGLAMDFSDIKFCQDYFKSENRDPSITEIKLIDTYWSDHCRHTTFNTVIDDVEFEDELLKETYEEYLSTRKKLNRTKPICLMDVATLAMKSLKKEGKLDKLDESDEINACTVHVDVDVNGKSEKWLLLFKNETHNHPTEIEPFGGAATCIGGAIRDPLSGRSYVYAAMRVTGAADPRAPLNETIKGKLSQRKIVKTAADGYSSYGNQIGLATGLVDEIYHPGYTAKRMEIGAVLGAAPLENVRREKPVAGDAVILLGGRTGRDGIGGATGSSKAHDLHSVETCGAEVQKGNAPEERKLQRLFRNKEACRMIKKCNDFGAGGVSVAIGELADGLNINLDMVPKKYEGLDGTELAISESQERMAVVVADSDVDAFLELAADENLLAVRVADVTDDDRLTMRWQNDVVVDISREFLDSNGADKHIKVKCGRMEDFEKYIKGGFPENMLSLAGDLNICSKRGLSEMFDSTIGAATVLMPFGGKYQRTPIQAMVHKIPVENGDTDDCSVMAYGFNPYISEKSCYHGAYLAVIESVSKLIAQGASFEEVYLSFQEYFEKLGTDSKRWGKPLSALLGAFKAQMDLNIAAIGGKDSMSGSFEKMDVPPTLVSFAVTKEKVDNIISCELKKEDNNVYLIKPKYRTDKTPNPESQIEIFNKVNTLIKQGKIISAYTPAAGGVAEAVMKMSFGNGFGFEFNDKLSAESLFKYNYGSFVVETAEDELFKDELVEDVFDITDENGGVFYLGKVIDEGKYILAEESVAVDEIINIYEDCLENVYECNIKTEDQNLEDISYENKKALSPAIKCASPKVVIPVFPGTNCEYDTKKAFENAGAGAEVVIINNLSSDKIKQSIDVLADKINSAQMIFFPGGFSGGDEPDGSAKFITSFFRNEKVKESVHELLQERNGLMGGICNGFQALIKLGLVPFGEIRELDEDCPTLTFNKIGRHQSKIVNIKIVSDKSPWLKHLKAGDVIQVPVSHGEGRFFVKDEILKRLIENGQIATRYVDLSGRPTDEIQYNPNGSTFAIEGITSPDGRIFGKMGHCERSGYGLYKNVPGNYDMGMFKSAVDYFA